MGNVLGYIIAQIAGAFVGACFVWVFYKDHFDAETDEGLKLACFSTGPNISNPINNFLSEVIATCIFMLAILGISHPDSGFGPMATFMVSTSIWGIGLSLGGTTGYAINPARDFGPRLAHAILPIKGKGSSDFAYAWIPIFGPILGAVLAVYIFKFLA
jgi:glycerol uptake facilitator protein